MVVVVVCARVSVCSQRRARSEPALSLLPPGIHDSSSETAFPIRFTSDTA